VLRFVRDNEAEVETASWVCFAAIADDDTLTCVDDADEKKEQAMRLLNDKRS
jgi:hypothetical protein